MSTLIGPDYPIITSGCRDCRWLDGGGRKAVEAGGGIETGANILAWLIS